ncbi:RagB/SusD family nutrient uptake outer membrane protein [Flavobacterium jejuense]|uniref:RagB/SusD family nutrient uptake outer membrane protein n=1 Tax=Flavobacterium jejuense TaxID=1544455 RepID=A0ABX0IL28_9FLAO|nr:RagB/SusD family nutrient uptake outer membrane protein [Flavobacterium jejuense]NHN24509.1 RagB/SusD family nutrient uptake outer membrane protein [Flavobacterium jejuense]
MKKIINIIGILLLSTSCNSEFTEVEPIGVLESDTFFDTETNTEKALIGLYDMMQFNNGVDWSSAFFLKLLPGDEANAGGGSDADQKQLQEVDDYVNISVSNPTIESVWNKYYRTIALANTIIIEVEKRNLNNKTFALAEAKFMRAWCYFELTTMWGAVPLRLENPKEISPEAFAKPKSSRAEIYVQIESDLTDAINGLPDKSTLTGINNNFRVSKGTAQALLGKVLVFQERYNEAIPYFEAVISNPAHDLEPNVSEVWRASSEFGIESLFEIGYISTSANDWNNFNWGGRTENNIHVQLMGPRGDGYFDLTGTGLINGWGFNLPSAKIISAFETAGDINRKAATLMTEAELNAVGGSLTGLPWDYEGAIRTKYATRAEETSPDGTVRELNYGTNWRLFRMAEVLLLASEAYNKVGLDENARTELNKIRQRAGLSDVSSTLSGTNLFDAIVNEKFLELSFEGQRFWDLVRWGRASVELSTYGYTSKNDLFPIPASEIAKNIALQPSDQNPGY